MVSVHIEYFFNSIDKATAVMLLGNRSVVFKSEHNVRTSTDGGVRSSTKLAWEACVLLLVTF
jgi:hypothetical protein